MIFVKQSTAVDVVIGPFIDDTDGKTAETALTLSQADCLLMKNGGASAQKNDATSATHLANGHYKVPLNTTDTGTLGVARLSIHETGALPCFLDMMVMPANVWDSLFGADLLQVDATQILGTAVATPATAGVLDVNAKAVNNSSTAAANVALDYLGTTTNATRPWTAKHIADVIESQRGHHTFSGNIYYVDGFGGDDSTGNGTRALPYKTISKALSVCTSGNHDVVDCLGNPGQVPTVISETATITVSKAYTLIRGPGRGVQVDLTGAGYVFDITAVGVEISGLDIVGNGTGTSGGVTVSTADFSYLHDLSISSPTQDGIQLTVSNNTLIERCTIVGAGRDNIRVASGGGAGQYTRILNNVLRDAVGSAVNLLGTDASECQIRFNVIRDNAVGITVGSGVTDAVITDNRFVNNTTRISDSGTRTLSAWNDIAEVWDAARAGHVAAGSFGEGVASVQGNVTGSVASVTGAVGSVTGSVGSVTGAVGSVTGAVGSVTGNVGGNVVGTVASVVGAVGSVAAGGITAASIATDAIDADAIAANAVTEIQAGLATAAALTVVDDFLDTEIAAIKAKTDNLPAAPAATGDIPSAATIATAVLTTAMTESYSADGVAPTLAQSLFLMMQRLYDFAISGTTITVKKLDGSTTAATITIDSATTPTSSSRAT